MRISRWSRIAIVVAAATFCSALPCFAEDAEDVFAWRVPVSLTTSPSSLVADVAGGVTTQAVPQPVSVRASKGLLTGLVLPAIQQTTAAARQPGPVAPPAQPPRQLRKKNKYLIGVGAVLMGVGVPMMIWGPTSTSEAAFTYSYNVKVAGAVFTAGGAVSLWRGLRGD